MSSTLFSNSQMTVTANVFERSYEDANTRRQDARSIYFAAVAAVDPFVAIKNCVSRRDNLLIVHQSGTSRKVYDLDTYKNIVVVGCGKAGEPMARALNDLAGDKIACGLVTVKYQHSSQREIGPIAIVEAGHPTPDLAGLDAAQETAKLLSRSGKGDLVIALLSGGGSSLWPMPCDSIELDDLVVTNDLLISSGASIAEINSVRKHISRISGGQAARMCKHAEVLVFSVSDVVDDSTEVIASGPFSPDPSTFADALTVVQKYDLARELPLRVREYLAAGLKSRHPETPKADDVIFKQVSYHVVASNTVAVRAAVRQARALGYNTTVVSTEVTGDARIAAKRLCDEMERYRDLPHEVPMCIICGGETTVSLGDTFGKGGRNQEFALASAFYLQNIDGVTLLACGTDGTDGCTDATGAIVDGRTIGACRLTKFDPQRSLIEHNAFPLLEKIDALVKTGPTHTNVMDIYFGLVA